MGRRVVVICMIAAIAQGLWAQVDTVNLPGVQVKSRVERDTVIKLGRLVDLSSVVSNLQLRSYGDGQVSTVSLDGLAARHTKVFVSGLNLVPSYLGVVDFSVFPMYLFGQLSVKSSFDDVRATGGFGGLLDFELSWPDSSFVESEPGFGSFGNRFLSQTVAFSQGPKVFFLKNYMQQAQNDFLYENDYLPGRPKLRMKNSDFWQGATLAGAGFRLNERLQVRSWAVFNSFFRHFPPPISYQGAERNEFQSVYQWFGGLNINYRLAQRSVVKFFMGGNAENSFYGLDYSGLNALKSFTDFGNLQSSLMFQVPTVSTGIRTEIENYTNILKPSQTPVLNAHRLKAIYFFRFGKRYRNFQISFFTGLIQADKQFYPTFSNNLSFKWVKFEFGRNVNLPTLNDLYWRPGGNPLLKPEQAYFLNIKTQKSFKILPLTVNLRIYQKLVKNWIQWKPTEYHYWQAQNLKFVWARGFVFSAKLKDLNIKNILLSNYLSLNYRHVTDTGGNQLIYTPNLLINNDLNIKKSNLNINLTIHYESKRFIVPGNKNYVLPAYLTGDCRVEADFFKHKKIKLNFGFIIKNITNTKYYQIIARPMPGRHYLLNLKLKF